MNFESLKRFFVFFELVVELVFLDNLFKREGDFLLNVDLMWIVEVVMFIISRENFIGSVFSFEMYY